MDERPARLADDVVKELKVQRAFGPEDRLRPLCPHCGCQTANLDPGNEDWMPSLCTRCLNRALEANRAVPAPPPVRRTRCNRCAEERVLAGAWCLECRDREQWKLVEAAVAAERRSDEQKSFLRHVAPHFAVWKRNRKQVEAWGLPFEPETVTSWRASKVV